MKLNSQKELIPVLYGDSAVKFLDVTPFAPNILCFPMHWHERMELLLVLSGELKLHIGENEVSAPANSLAIVPPRRPHMGVSGKNGVAYRTMMFDVSLFYNQASATAKFLKPIVSGISDFIAVTENKETVALAHSLTKEHLNGDDVSPLIIMGKIYELLGLLYRHCLCERPVAASDDRLKNVIDFIEENYCENISSVTLSRQFGYTEAYFCRRFKSVTGLTPMEYIQILRLENARRKIKHSDLKISEISAACGFSDPSYFSRCFKKRYGITPAEYSENNK